MHRSLLTSSLRRRRARTQRAGPCVVVDRCRQRGIRTCGASRLRRALGSGAPGSQRAGQLRSGQRAGSTRRGPWDGRSRMEERPRGEPPCGLAPCTPNWRLGQSRRGCTGGCRSRPTIEVAGQGGTGELAGRECSHHVGTAYGGTAPPHRHCTPPLRAQPVPAAARRVPCRHRVSGSDDSGRRTEGTLQGTRPVAQTSSRPESTATVTHAPARALGQHLRMNSIWWSARTRVS